MISWLRNQQTIFFFFIFLEFLELFPWHFGVLSGVPEGSALRTLLFTVLMNDLRKASK
jgi:hypothetical protein